MGPVGSDGKPIGFTCTDVGGNALLVWNASQITSDLTINGTFNTLNYYPGTFFVNSTFKSNGPVGFIGGKVTINGSIIASSVLIAGASSTESELDTTLLAPAPNRITPSTTARVIVGATGKINATNGNLVIAGASIQNNGELTAKKGSAILKTGSKLDIGWTDVNWIDGVHGTEVHSLINGGTITAADAVLEAHRAVNNNPNTNNKKIAVSNSITFITGFPGMAGITGSLGIVNGLGELYAAKVTISPYYQTAGGGTPQDRTFLMKNAADRTQLNDDIGGVSHPTQDNTPTSTTAVVNDSTPRAGVSAPTIVIPQLTPSVTYLNATSKPVVPMLAVAKQGSEQVRGSDTQPANQTKKARAKAKPVLMRGAFFDSKISAVVSSHP